MNKLVCRPTNRSSLSHARMSSGHDQSNRLQVDNSFSNLEPHFKLKTIAAAWYSVIVTHLVCNLKVPSSCLGMFFNFGIESHFRGSLRSPGIYNPSRGTKTDLPFVSQFTVMCHQDIQRINYTWCLNPDHPDGKQEYYRKAIPNRISKLVHRMQRKPVRMYLRVVCGTHPIMKT